MTKVANDEKEGIPNAKPEGIHAAHLSIGKLPGTRGDDSDEVIYITCTEGVNVNDLFHKVMDYIGPMIPQKGSALLEEWFVTTPDGVTFFSICFFCGIEKEQDGWRQQITLGAQGLGLPIATIVGESFVIDHGASYPLSDCLAEER